jgi:hypothetical protein
MEQSIMMTMRGVAPGTLVTASHHGTVAAQEADGLPEEVMIEEAMRMQLGPGISMPWVLELLP